MQRVLIILSVAFVLASCSKEPGEGGNSSIYGKVTKDFRIVLTNPDTYQYSAPARDENVFIIYGDHVSPDDNVETNHLGEFEFRNLRKGDYTLYVYSGDTTGSNQFENNGMPVVKEISIDSRNEEIDLGEFVIYDTP